ncbi:13701_t:CDS:2 [Funneliformis geosporum]|uniref:17140_t:CDS:1 n=1 Tax=Funneliformis geosporum TaxID=1117311 RepID=A0A9W4ST82_9GLOM|nr:13701_t:CDS:2 [Funneliformis geosporum]CAI2180476.1 17140_t:CDS:2 [Funneliformis geosporum]
MDSNWQNNLSSDENNDQPSTSQNFGADEVMLKAKNQWNAHSEELLLLFLVERIEDVKKLKKRGITAKNVKGKLWNDATVMLRSYNYVFNAKKCAIKYKELIQNEKKG